MNDPAVEIENLTKIYRERFSNRHVKAVSNLSLNVEQGTVMGLIGPNGAGKTTTIYCLLGLLIPDEGRISIFGESPQSRETRKYIGFQSEIFHTYNFLKPAAALKFYGRLSGMSGAHLDNRINFQLNRLGLDKVRDRKVGSFSKGMKQRLGVAQALLHDPNLLVLDEPFTGLDPEGRRLIADIVLEEKREGKTVFFSSHILSDIERLCDHVTMIREGEVVFSKDIQKIIGSNDLWVIAVTGWEDKFKEQASEWIQDINEKEKSTELICTEDHKDDMLKALLALPVDIIGVHTKSWTLEEHYMKMDRGEGATNA